MAPATMRAAAPRGPGEIEVREVPVPEPAPGEVRVRVEACGICGSDLHMLHAGFLAPGRTPGHEMAGRVDALGDGVSGVATGTRVAVEPLRACGTCPYCASGRPALCPAGEIYGIHRDGGDAEYVCVPAERLFVVPDTLPPALAALAEPTAVVVHGLRRGRFEPGQRVLVLGAGTIGLLAVQASVALGAGEVWVTARHAHQAELAAGLGAARVLGEHEASAEGLQRLGAGSDIDLVVETVGSGADTLTLAGHAVRRGGSISVLGVFYGDVAIPALPLFLKEGSIHFSNCYARGDEGADFETAIGILSAHRDVLAAVTTHAFPLGAAPEAFRTAADRKAGAVKVTLLPGA